MTIEELKERIPESDLIFVASRSSGPGGQNVNKVNTRIELRFNLMDSVVFSVHEKELLIAELHNRINLAGELVVRSQSERTQLGNKNKCVERLMKLIATALSEKALRIKTSPTPKSISERIEKKRLHSKLKQSRSAKGIQDPDQ